MKVLEFDFDKWAMDDRSTVACVYSMGVCAKHTQL